ncbi:MAG: nuclear transport factor 2 family protein [Acidobacteriaceae bacterium]
MRIGRMLARELVLAAVVLGICVQSKAQSTPVEAAKTFLAAFNAGDNAKAAALSSSNGVVIVDEFVPHLWTGKSAFATWIADYDKDAKTKGITDPLVTMGAPLVNTITGDVAYLVCPMTYTYRLKSASMREPARMAMVLHKEGAVWRFRSWTWTGTIPKAATK